MHVIDAAPPRRLRARAGRPVSATRAARRSSHSHPRRTARSGSSRSRLSSMTRRCVAPRCSQTINSPCGGRAVRSTSMLLRQQRRIVPNDDEDAIKRGADRVGSGAWRAKAGVRPRMAKIHDDRISIETSNAPARWNASSRQSRVHTCFVVPESPAVPADPALGWPGHPTRSPITGRSPKQLASPRSSRRRYSRSATVPPSISQSTSTTDRPAENDHARLVAHEVEVCPARVVHTPRSKLTVLACFPKALHMQRHREWLLPCLR